MKICTKCEILKEKGEFSKRKESKNGLASWCKVCVSEYHKGRDFHVVYDGELKTCSKCGEKKDKGEFNKCKGQKDGLNNWCKICYSEWYKSSEGFNIDKAHKRFNREAEKRGIDNDITLEQFEWFTNMKVCSYCGGKISFTIGRYNLDRENNSLGYTMKNLVVCCPKCNRMKNVLTGDDFLKKCKQIAEYQRSRKET